MFFVAWHRLKPCEKAVFGVYLQDRLSVCTISPQVAVCAARGAALLIIPNSDSSLQSTFPSKAEGAELR